MKKCGIALLAVLLLVGCKNVVERTETNALIIMPKAPQPGPADHAYALAYADIVRTDWVRDVIAQNKVREAEMIGLRNDYLDHAGAFEVQVYAWPPRVQAGNMIYSSWATGEQEAITRVHWYTNGLGCTESQLLMQAYAEERSGRKIEAGEVPYPTH